MCTFQGAPFKVTVNSRRLTGVFPSSMVLRFGNPSCVCRVIKESTKVEVSMSRGARKEADKMSENLDGHFPYQG